MLSWIYIFTQCPYSKKFDIFPKVYFLSGQMLDEFDTTCVSVLMLHSSDVRMLRIKILTLGKFT